MKRRIAIIVGGLVAAGLAFILRSESVRQVDEGDAGAAAAEALSTRRADVAAWLDVPEGPALSDGPSRRGAAGLRSRVEIHAEGSVPVSTTPDDVVATMLHARVALAECLVELPSDLIRTTGVASLQLHVAASGAIQRIAFEPPVPERIGGCFERALASQGFDPPGGPMSVAFQFGSPPRRVQSDAGVPMFLSGDRPVEQPELPPHVE